MNDNIITNVNKQQWRASYHNKYGWFFSLLYDFDTLLLFVGGVGTKRRIWMDKKAKEK